MRLTKNVREQILMQNEGFTADSYYEAKNSRESRFYAISDGQLHVKVKGKGSWGGSHYEREFIADDDQTRRFLRNHLGCLNTQGVS
ncbi:MAG: hypothetical protein J5804_04500 [Eggerthellaceae bacterium]|nr:hypothetical protein [Eggerthellaceae bacterium]